MRSTHLLLFVVLESRILNSASEKSPKVNGKCTKSLYLGATSEPQRWQQCQKYCTTVEGSSSFTYKPGSSYCLCWANCEDLSTSKCPSCISGDVSISNDECFLPNVRVHGILISVDAAADAKECAEECKALEACKWFTYDKKDQSCLLTKDKQFTSDCPTCTYGHDHCIQEGRTSLFTCGGWNGKVSLADAEVTDLPSLEGSDPNRTCHKVPELPSDKYAPFAIWDESDKSVLCCGGDGSSSSCFKYTKAEWIDLGDILIHERRYSSAAKLSDGRYWISGGIGFGARTSEFYQDGEFSEGPRLPNIMYQHCAVEVEPGFVFISGNNRSGYENLAFQFDPESGTFRSLADMTRGRGGHGCGVVNKGDSYDIVVAGGENDWRQRLSHTEIYNSKTRQWRSGPPLPQKICCMPSVQYEDTFLLVGGFGSQAVDTIYQYNRSSQNWILRQERLSRPKNWVGAVLAGPPAASCC